MRDRWRTGLPIRQHVVAFGSPSSITQSAGAEGRRRYGEQSDARASALHPCFERSSRGASFSRGASRAIGAVARSGTVGTVRAIHLPSLGTLGRSVRGTRSRRCRHRCRSAPKGHLPPGTCRRSGCSGALRSRRRSVHGCQPAPVRRTRLDHPGRQRWLPSSPSHFRGGEGDRR